MLDDFFIDATGLRRGVTHVKVVAAGPQYDHLCRYLDTTGDGLGTVEATGNYSVTPEEFYVQPPAGEVWVVNNLIFYIRDTGFMQAGEYGNTGSALTNGISIRHIDDSGTLADITNGEPLLVNTDLDAICAEFRKTDYAGIAEAIVGIIDFDRDGSPVRLVGDDNGRLVVALNDNFTGLDGHRFRAGGFREIVT